MDNSKKSPKKVTNKEKIEVCEKYQDYLRVMHLFGNNTMLLKQLHQFGEALKLYSSPSMFQRQMEEMLEHDIIKYESFFLNGRATQHKIVILRKFALRYLKGATDSGGSQKVAPVPALKTNDRILIATFKGAFILQRVIPSLKKTHQSITIDLILRYISNHYMSILTEKNKGIEYAKLYFSKFKDFLEEDFMEDQINRLQGSLDRRNQGLEYGSKVGQGKGKASVVDSGVSEGKRVEKAIGMIKEKDELFSQKDKKLAQYSFENMVRSNIQIIRIETEKKPKKVKVTALLFDCLNKQDLYALSKQIACFYKMLNDSVRMDDCELYLTVAIVGYDQLAIENMERDANEVVYSPFTGQQDKRLALTLRNWQVSKEQQDKRLTIKFTHYDITNEYLEGKKIANLLQGKPETKTNQG
jgi:hypothetical protein